jgi:hypothetical protein
MDTKVGVRALLSGVVPRNLMMLIGLEPSNHSVDASPAEFARSDVLPHPPSPYKTIGFSQSLNMWFLMRSSSASRP